MVGKQTKLFISIFFIFIYNLCLNFFHHLLARKPNLEKCFILYSNKFFHNFHISESSSSFTCHGLCVKWVSAKTDIGYKEQGSDFKSVSPKMTIQFYISTQTKGWQFQRKHMYICLIFTQKFKQNKMADMKLGKNLFCRLNCFYNEF